MNENQNAMQNQQQNPNPQPASPINWERLEALMASVWEYSKETDRMVKEASEQIKETGKVVKETSEQMKETDRMVKEASEQIKETGKVVKETSEQMKESGRRIEESRKETDRRIAKSRKETDKRIEESRKETDKRIEESRIKTDRQLELTGKKIDQLSEEVSHLMKRTSSLDNEWGRFLEEMCVPSCIDIFKKEGIGITQRYADVTHAKDAKGVEMEVDVILCNTTEAVVIEVKSNCTQKHIDHFIDQMQHFKRIFHPFDRYKVYAAIVGMKFQNGVEKYARNKGLYVIRCTAEGVFALLERPDPALYY